MYYYQHLLRFLVTTWLVLSIHAVQLHPRQSPTPPVTYDQFVQNITIDNAFMTGSPSQTSGTAFLGYISFFLSGNWTTVTSPDFGYRGSFLWTNDPQAKAVLTFKGIAAYYMAPLFSGTAKFQSIVTDIELDTEPVVLVNLTAPFRTPSGGVNASVSSKALWGHPGLSNTKHTLTISMNQGAQYAILDALVYTAVVDDGSPASPSASSSPSPSSGIRTSSSMSTTHIALIATFSVVAALLLLAVFLFYRRRQQSRASSTLRAQGVRRWVDMRWVNASRTNLGGLGVAVGEGDVKNVEAVRMDKLARG